MRALALAACTAVLVTGCIGESDPPTNPTVEAEHAGASAAPDSAAAVTTVSAVLNEWSITLSSTTVKQGTVSFEIRNEGTEDHAFEVEGAGQEWKTDAIKPGESATLSAVLEPGTYEVYCPLASGGEAHADRGMRTSITVQ
jgi:uncharacterized cupredoxin-like copper-binding protein